jgi:manganese oxidase
MWIDLIVEYIAGFAFGLFIFQSLFMKSMMGGTYWENVRKSFVPEFISMNFMMAGMAPVMSFLMMGRDMRAMEPTELLFWGVMSIGVIAGFILAYPSNVWMVARQLKHGLMTERGPKWEGAAMPPGAMAHEQPQLQLQLQAHAGVRRDHGHDHRCGRGPHEGHRGMKSDATMAQNRGSRLRLLPGPPHRHAGPSELDQHDNVGARRRRCDHAARHDHGPQYVR